MRIFLDANILFSAAKSDGAIRRLLRLLADKGHQCTVDAYVSEEARRNIAAKSPETMPILEALLSHMPGVDAHLGDLSPDTAALLPDKDRPVLAASIRLGCAALVTGDRTHFGALYGKTIQGVTIHSPRSIAIALLD